MECLVHRISSCDRFEVLYELWFEYLQKDNVKALDFIRQAEEAALSSSDSLWIVKSKRVKAVALYYLERNVEALTVFDEVLPMAKRNGFETEGLAIRQYVGRIHVYEGHYDKALSFFLEGLQLAENLKDPERHAIALQDVAICYYKLSDYAQALQYFFESLELFQTFSIHHGVILTNIALCHANLGELVKAKEANAKVDQMSKEVCPDVCQMNLKYSMGLVAMLDGGYTSAETYLLESYAIAEKLGNTRFRLDDIYLLTQIFVRQKNFRRVQQYLGVAEDLMRRNRSYNLEMIKIYSRFSEVYIELQDFRKASIYQSKYIVLRDSIYRVELTNNLMKVQADHAQRENSARITAQAEVITLTREVADGQRKLTLATAALAGLVAVILIFVLRQYQRKRELNILLDRKVRERTIALESGRNELVVIVKEQDLILQHISSGIRQKLKTIDGLCRTAEEDLSDTQAGFYLSKIQSTLKEIEERMDSTQAHIQTARGSLVCS